MDRSIIKAEKINTVTGILYGNMNAQKKMAEFINVACPYCRQWFNESYDLLENAVKKGQVQRVIKLFDKEKASLQRGNVMHHHITITNGEKALAEIKKIFDSQDEWKNLSLTEVASYATNELGLSLQKDSQIFQKIIDEANEAIIRFVPTIILNGNIFDESIQEAELLSYIKE
ncbi:thioredoxin domain-containing protein [Enterococcus ratti]|uniref:Bifunctional disulfide isomerase/thiol-disulfide oxidase n=1 Tax=Enterococcus ratti TaxID=150033 RepID=A0A1L8WIP2_9ENTE|nr:thioredoxin domain-containing protein [Enterococcus ratti]OJG80898.1 bifunctional disulfide isomerase/thiol-disulfide oxidase [Enterococcus ratti]